jgi:hypothetical protein
MWAESTQQSLLSQQRAVQACHGGVAAAYKQRKPFEHVLR